MHIAYLIPTIDRIGGAERQLLLVATGMAARGCRVTVISLHGSGGLAADQLSAANVSFLTLEMNSGLRDVRGWKTLRRWISSAQPEIVHAHLAQAALMARAIRTVAPIRVLIDTIHSPATGSTTRQTAYRLTSRIPDCVTAVSHTAARPWLNARIVDHHSLAVIPNGIDTQRWTTQESPKALIGTTASSFRAFRWLAVGRLEPVKDYATMLRAFAMLPPSARLTICGSGPLETDLRSLAASLNVQERISFLGFQTDLRPLMHRHDAFVLSSQWEGLPLALLEASACALPAVFTDLEGCREVLPHYSLPVAPAGNPQALAAAMNTLMDLPEPARAELGDNAREQIVSRFDLSSVLDRYEILYRNLLANNPAPRRFRQHAGSSLHPLTDNASGANQASEGAPVSSQFETGD